MKLRLSSFSSILSILFRVIPYTIELYLKLYNHLIILARQIIRSMKQISDDVLCFKIMKGHSKSTSIVSLDDYRRSLILTHLATLINERRVNAYYTKRVETRLVVETISSLFDIRLLRS